MELSEEDVNMLESAKKTSSSSSNDTTIKIGDICVEQKPSVDGEEMPKRYYRILGIINKINDIEINSYLIKEVSPTQDGKWAYSKSNRTKFSLTRSDCKFLNIDYEDGIEVYPFPSSDEVFKKYIVEEKPNEKNIDYNDLSTYPVSSKDNCIRHIIIQLNGFMLFNDDGLIAPRGKVYKTAWFFDNLKVRIKKNIGRYSNKTASFTKGTLLPYRIIAKDGFNLIDDNGNISLEVATSIPSDKTYDGIVGIAPEALKMTSVNDLFEVSYECYDAIQEKDTFREYDIWDSFEKYFDSINKRIEGLSKQSNGFFKQDEWIVKFF